MKLKASINVKINLIIVCSLILVGVVTIMISSYSYLQNGKEEISGYRNAILKEKKELLRSLVDTASDIVKYQYLAAKEDKDSLIEYKQLALDTINALRYGKDKSGYYYTVDTVTRKMIQHPKASLIGKSDTFFKDADGKQQIVAQIDVAIKSGKGFDEYKWPKLNEDKPQPKLTYIKHFKEWNMAIATGIYIDDIDKSVILKEELIESNSKYQIIKLSIAVGVCILLTVLVAFIIVYGGIVKPIKTMIHLLKDIAEGEGDLTKRIVDNSGDETEEMSNWINQFIEQVQNIIKDVTGNSVSLHSSSKKLSELAGTMAVNAEGTSSKANSVAAAGEEMSSNMTSVAAAMEEASTNVSMVATATEEMSTTINEIAENTEKARGITTEAVSKTTSASNQVGELGKAAREIGKVVETITDISGQVDLLALNATIEAARAGDAGKGFAVVANEIKELARQTAEATGEIKNRVESIQTSTDGTVKEINTVSEVVNEIDSIVSTIAISVEEQSATTNEIVNNVSQASIGLGEVNENVAQSSTVSEEIARDIGEVTSASQEISDSCNQVNERSDELAGFADQLNNLVMKFKV